MIHASLLLSATTNAALHRLIMSGHYAYRTRGPINATFARIILHLTTALPDGASSVTILSQTSTLADAVHYTRAVAAALPHLLPPYLARL